MQQLTPNGKWTVTNITYTVMLLILTALTFWLFEQQQKDLEFRLAGNRFTKEDGIALERRILDAMPPKYLYDHLSIQVDKIDQRTHKLEECRPECRN